jgi:hypothetical protein
MIVHYYCAAVGDILATEKENHSMYKYIILFSTASILVMCGCSPILNPENSNNVPFTLTSDKRMMSISDTASVWITDHLGQNNIQKIEWSVTNGYIDSDHSPARFYPPSHADTVTIRAFITSTNGIVYDQAFTIYVYRQLIILKADDLVFDGATTISPRWKTFIDYIRKKNIKAGIGVIGDSLRKGNYGYRKLVGELHNSEHFEIWNHGYNHIIGTINGTPYDEFRNSSYEYQLEQLTKAQNDVKKYAGITMRAFGAPGCAIDENTIRALDDIDDIKVWFFGLEGSSKLLMCRVLEIEYVTGSPDFTKFGAYYPTRCDKEYIVLNIHPNQWDSEKFDVFASIIDYLIGEKVTFITPYEYYLLKETALL